MHTTIESPPEAHAGRPKWNSILKADDQSRMGKAMAPPGAQPNQRSRSESVPEIRTIFASPPAIDHKLSEINPEMSPKMSSEMNPEMNSEMNPESSLLLSNIGDSHSLSKMLEISLKWDKGDTSISPLSPIRSPIVADWKAVGSPIAPQGHNEIEQNPSPPNGSKMQTLGRRQRAMSLIEKGVFPPRSFSPFDLKNLKINPSEGAMLQDGSENGNQSSNATSPDKLGKSGLTLQVAQLPQELHEVLGVVSADEATEIFKRSSMDSLKMKTSTSSPIDSDSSPAKQPLSSMPSLFGRMPFGPAAMVFGSIDQQSKDPADTEDMDELKTDSFGRRHSSLFGLPADWSNDAPAEFSVDDYFSNAALSRKHPRRHSIASTGVFPEVDEHLGSLSLASSSAQQMESNLSPSAASFHFRGYGSQSSSSLLDYLSMTSSGEDLLGSGGGAHGTSYPSISASSMRDVSFQLSSYKGPLYAVEFKAGRTEIFYVLEIDGKPQLRGVRVGELVIVEADRGEDLGKVTIEISVDKLKQLMMPGSEAHNRADKDSDILTPELAALVHSKEIVPKRIHRLAQPSDLKLLQAKAQEEAIAMVRCQSRIRQKKLPMEVVDAEYQWDRNKLTFYFCADRRIDFRELVRDLFRIYKTRIWMCAVDKSSPRMLMYTSPSGAAGSASFGNSSPGDASVPSTTFFSFGGGHPNLS